MKLKKDFPVKLLGDLLAFPRSSAYDQKVKHEQADKLSNSSSSNFRPMVRGA
jgi:hypothetical protein